MKYRIKNLGVFFAIALLAASCAGKAPVKTPEPTPQPIQPVVQPEPPKVVISQAELDDLLSQVQGLKKHAFDLKLYEVLADAYKGANDSYIEAKAAYDSKDAPAAKEKLGGSIGLFKDLIAKGVVELASMRRKDADDLRAASVKVGADVSMPDRFLPAEKAYAAGKTAVDAADHEAAIASFERARLLFELAWKRAQASSLKEKIATLDYSTWDSGNAATADLKYAEEDRLFAAAGGPETAASTTVDPAKFASGIDALDEALLRYNLVVQKGRTSIAVQKKQKTDEAKQRSETIKANVAAKEAYDAALSTYQAGVSALAAGDYEIASNRFEEAGVVFERAYEIAADKRAKAAAAMEAAATAADASRKKAQDADVQVGSESATSPEAAPAEPTDPAPATTGTGN